MHTQQTDPVIEKLAKILRLANCKGATPGEVEAAMLAAKALAQKHQIDIAMVSLEDPNEKKSINIQVVKDECAMRSQRFQLYHHYIWDVLYHMFGVRVIRFGNTKFFFVGETTDVLVCKQLFPWLEDVFCSTYSKARSSGLLRDCAAHKRGCYLGIVRGIIQANKHNEPQHTAKEAECLALVVRRKEDLIEEVLKDVKVSKSREVDHDSFAYGLGKQAGLKINLNQVQQNTAQRAQLK